VDTESAYSDESSLLEEVGPDNTGAASFCKHTSRGEFPACQEGYFLFCPKGFAPEPICFFEDEGPLCVIPGTAIKVPALCVQ